MDTRIQGPSTVDAVPANNAGRRAGRGGMIARSSLAPALIVLLCVSLPMRASARSVDSPAQTGIPAVRNPQRLRASEVRERRTTPVEPRIRFEWDQVAGVRQYSLYGRWTTPPSWTIQSREYRVTPQTAAQWDARRVAFDVSLPKGSHSWKLVALYGPKSLGDFEKPTQLSFEVR